MISETATTELDQQGQQCPAHQLSSKPDSVITVSPCAHTINLQSVGDKFQPETEIPCPCCHQIAMEKAFFPPLVIKPGREGYWMYHCMNVECPGKHRTLSLEEFTQQFGKVQP